MAKLRLRIDFEPAGSLGPGKVALLEAIRRCGSISSAARAETAVGSPVAAL